MFLKANGGLLLGVVRAAYRRGNEAERWRRSLERAGKEQAKLKEVLDRAVSEKRKVGRCGVIFDAPGFRSCRMIAIISGAGGSASLC